ncbi:hypothetical protein [Streptomyces sp. NPDC002054]|uniref:hypothetical protein n=1 Tax=Streptomyces sp. NPDC002054 TaxID=3154663 RepID=UPI0033277963
MTAVRICARCNQTIRSVVCETLPTHSASGARPDRHVHRGPCPPLPADDVEAVVRQILADELDRMDRDLRRSMNPTPARATDHLIGGATARGVHATGGILARRLRDLDELPAATAKSIAAWDAAATEDPPDLGAPEGWDYAARLAPMALDLLEHVRTLLPY